MKKIKINGLEGWCGEEGWYCVENNELLYKCLKFKHKTDPVDGENITYDDINVVQISDLTELKVWQYNELVKQLFVHYPDYDIDKLEGKFI